LFRPVTKAGHLGEQWLKVKSVCDLLAYADRRLIWPSSTPFAPPRIPRQARPLALPFLIGRIYLISRCARRCR
jgi:hypothetical protein